MKCYEKKRRKRENRRHGYICIIACVFCAAIIWLMHKDAPSIDFCGCNIIPWFRQSFHNMKKNILMKVQSDDIHHNILIGNLKEILLWKTGLYRKRYFKRCVSIQEWIMEQMSYDNLKIEIPVRQITKRTGTQQISHSHRASFCYGYWYWNVTQ